MTIHPTFIHLLYIPVSLYFLNLRAYIKQIINISFLHNHFETLHFIGLGLNTSHYNDPNMA